MAVRHRKRNRLRRVVDVCLLVLLLCLMSYQVTGEEKHEWTGVTMTLTVIVHQLLNRRWYAALFRGRYNAYRHVTTLVDLLLLAAMLATAFCGMSMSEYAVPFLYWERGVSLVRPTHLAMSHWAFLLMGLHLGLHVPLMAGKGVRHGAAEHPENMDTYDTILLGYPNWWASIPMPIASFLEAYDFSGKQIIPFCSHGGGRFGQSLTAIAKLAPDADMGEGLSIHYSGGSSLPGDVSRWLEKNRIAHN